MVFNLTGNEAALTHSAAWAVLLSWIFVLQKVAECPCVGVYIYILQVVLQDVLAFLLSMFSLILGFAFAFHLILKAGNHGFSSPISSILGTLAMIVGHYGDNEVLTSHHVPGTTEVIFVTFFVVVSIGIMNILIGLSIANIKDIMMQKEDFKLARMILNNKDVEDAILFMARMRMVKCCKCLTKMANLLDSNTTVFKVFPYTNRPEQQLTKAKQAKTGGILPLRFGNATSISNMTVFRQTSEPSEETLQTTFSLPGNVV